jgi:hypothetical protein
LFVAKEPSADSQSTVMKNQSVNSCLRGNLSFPDGAKPITGLAVYGRNRSKEDLDLNVRGRANPGLLYLLVRAKTTVSVLRVGVDAASLVINVTLSFSTTECQICSD